MVVRFSIKQMTLLSMILSGALAFQPTNRGTPASTLMRPAINPTKRSNGYLQQQLPLQHHLFQPKKNRFRRRRSSFAIVALASSPSDDTPNYQSSTAEACFSWLTIALPLASAIFPALLEFARSQPPGSGEQLTALTVLFASNRIYLYAMSTTIVGLVALRSASQDSVQLGQRVVDLTEELLYSPPLTGSGSTQQQPQQRQQTPQQTSTEKQRDGETTLTSTAIAKDYQSSAMIQNLSNELGDSLDDVSSSTQAILLPVLVSALFASSFFFVKFLNGDNPVTTIGSGGTDELANLFKTYGPLLTSVWNVLILTLFTRCEIRRLSLSNGLFTPRAGIAWSLACWCLGAAITALAFAGIWQAQNVVNIALAVLVARAIQINDIPAVLGALSLLTLYDATSVLFLPATAATIVSDVVTTTTSTVIASAQSPDTIVEAAKSSAMGAVAVDKLTSTNFQPGLLVTKLEGRVGGALGLGDAVFPSLLATMARRFDLEQDKSDGKMFSLFAASMVGYVVGCVACEVVPFLSTTGVPALLLIVPFMVGSTLAAAGLRGDLNAFWEFEPETVDGKDS